MREGLKPLNELLKVDERNLCFLRTNLNAGDSQRNSIEAHYANIEEYGLNEFVPDAIATQYNVSRNIFLYAWFQYRFFNFAEGNVLTVLELALRKRIGESAMEAYVKNAGKNFVRQLEKE